MSAQPLCHGSVPVQFSSVTKGMEQGTHGPVSCEKVKGVDREMGSEDESSGNELREKNNCDRGMQDNTV